MVLTDKRVRDALPRVCARSDGQRTAGKANVLQKMGVCRRVHLRSVCVPVSRKGTVGNCSLSSLQRYCLCREILSLSDPL